VATRRRGLERQEEIKVKVTGFLIKCSELAPAARESQVGKLAGGCGGRKVSCSGSTTNSVKSGNFCSKLAENPTALFIVDFVRYSFIDT
jgi:hypothetical protein